MLSSFDCAAEVVRHISVNACLVPLYSLHKCAVTTVEGIGSMRAGLHPVQERLARLHGSQCGFCTPGIVMAVYSFLRRHPAASAEAMEAAMDGNLCRCTGYRPILDAAKSLAHGAAAERPCCRAGSGGEGCPCAETAESESSLSMGGEFCSGAEGRRVQSDTEGLLASSRSLTEEMRSRSLSEPIFPPALMPGGGDTSWRPLLVRADGATWSAPESLAALLTEKADNPLARIIVGNTEHGIEVKTKGRQDSVYLLYPARVSELKVLAQEKTGVRVGAAVVLEDLREYISNSCHSGERERWRLLSSVREALDWFASIHIRNAASIGGNIATASPISDLIPVLCAAAATMRMVSLADDGCSLRHREVRAENFFLSYRTVDIRLTEVLQDVFIPFAAPWEYSATFQQGRRREDEISAVNCCFRVKLHPNDERTLWVVERCSLFYGGMAPTVVRASEAESILTGSEWCAETVRHACAAIQTTMHLDEAVPGGQAAYRVCLASSFLFKAYLKLSLEHLNAVNAVRSSEAPGAALPPAAPVMEDEISGGFSFLNTPRSTSRGKQSYYRRAGGLTDSAHSVLSLAECFPPSPVGDCIPHKSAELQVTGQAQYTDDATAPIGTAHAGFVVSTNPHALVLEVKFDHIAEDPAFIAFVDHRDVLGSNMMGAISQDEEIFASREVHHVGAIIAVVLAATHEDAVRLARLVQVRYEGLPAVMSIQEALSQNSFFPETSPQYIYNGDLQAMEAESEVLVSGHINVGGQEHFYLEPHSCIVIPTDDNELNILASTQGIKDIQTTCASACGIPASKVVVRVKRIGGGFGGKESKGKTFYAPAAVAAHKLGIPVRACIDRDLDMLVSGQRHAFRAEYRAGCRVDGSLCCLNVRLYSNAGFSMDLSEAVMTRAMLHIDNVYQWPALHVEGVLCRTNQASHTAFRGFGAPQAMFVTETVIEHLASELQLRVARPVSSLHMRRLNMYGMGAETHYGSVLDNFKVPEAFDRLAREAEYNKREGRVDEFNCTNRYKKRGISVIPTKFGIGYGCKSLHQAGGLVHINCVPCSSKPATGLDPSAMMHILDLSACQWFRMSLQVKLTQWESAWPQTTSYKEE